MCIIVIVLFFFGGILSPQHQPSVWAGDVFKEHFGVVSLDKALEVQKSNPLKITVTFPFVRTVESFGAVLSASRPTLIFRINSSHQESLEKTIALARDVALHVSYCCQIILMEKSESEAIFKKYAISLRNTYCEILFYNQGIMYEFAAALTSSVLVSFIKKQSGQHP